MRAPACELTCAEIVTAPGPKKATTGAPTEQPLGRARSKPPVAG